MNKKIGVLTLFFLMLPLVGVWPSAAVAGQKVQGRYLEKSGDKIVIELKIEGLPPALIIVRQSLPVGVQVAEARPASKLADPGRGEVKWLLSGLTAGIHRLELVLDRAVAAKAGGGEIRYRDPTDGRMVSVPIAER